MTKTKISLLILALLLLFSTPCWAADPDIDAMTPAQLQAYIQQLQTKTPTPQTQIVTIQADTQLNNQLTILQEELASMKEELTKMQDRFGRLATDTSTAIEASNKTIIEGVEAKTSTQLNTQSKEVKDYIDQKTNPIRQNAPAVGSFLILSGCFLLWASKQYRLCQGSQNLDKSSETDSVSKMTQGARNK